ncbi:MAG: NAD(P)-dependent alcohol dehydrogenase [Acidimicrobiia bacterium]|nr:NAD(P)-dependent alcohol dehydrogenase [Acidimicrobiia bacterium]NNL69597.1 NAD(P)-dependent alcohol dehydrogenase [Acidimicrobiia bacterium]
MKAIVYKQYGPPDVLAMREVETPVPGENQLLIRVRAASVNRSDWETLIGKPAFVRLSGAGVFKPKKPILGSDVAGTVEAAGPDVSGFSPGDEVFGDVIWHGASAFAEYVCVSETAPLVTKPASVSFEEAAALPQAGVLALQGLRRVRETRAGDRVLIVGAGGGGGSFAIQLAKLAGAHVTGVDNTGKLDYMTSLGADQVIDYTRETVSGARYDRIIDFAGRRSIFGHRSVLADSGVYSMVGGTVPRLLQAATVGWVLSKLGPVDMRVLLVQPNREDLSALAGMVEAGTLVPAIERTYDLAEAPLALARLGANEAQGKLIIRI